MKNKDHIENLFKRLENQWDTEQLPSGHEDRFMTKLKGKSKQPQKNRWIFTIAASLIIITGLYFFISQNEPANIQPDKNLWTEASKQTKETHDYFSSVVDTELKKLQNIENPETKPIVDDALEQMKMFEADYQKILLELQKNGDTKQILHAMILNFQTRISFLEDVITKIEIINQQKNTDDEKVI